MHFCTAMVMVAGDKDQIVFRDKFSPVSWPEVEVLRIIHGEDAVFDVKPFIHVEQSSREERVRLILKYGKEYVDEALGQGRSIKDEFMQAVEADIAHGETWKNPLIQLEETIGGDGPPLDAEPVKPRNSKGVFVKAEASL